MRDGLGGWKYVGGMILVLAPAAAAGAINLSAASPPTPLPFDPLSSGEQVQAIDLALEDAGVSAQLSSRYEVIGAALFTDKSFDNLPTWPRIAEVWFFDYEANQALRAFVDLGARFTYGVELLDVQPPLTGGEIEHVGRMALEDERVQARFVDAAMDVGNVTWTARLWTGDAPTACPEHRCALVGFEYAGSFVYDVAVLVDLALDTVLRVSGPGLRELGVAL